MTFKELKLKIKEEQKVLAQKIKNGKSGRKPKNRTKENLSDYDNLWLHRRHYRHKHIVYCNMFNGTPYDKIERAREGNRPDSYLLNKYKKEWEGMLDEQALRDCA